ncbi:PREDICTED: myb/SANT-like DNA-binding domain-containing protein 4, partial [Vollenhovia emeryi]|uniref:myb/SANT-like DNA-binding domain-containing protein 4 n=1 Tax=Vollenhovia emeryi TaxID=411798 RepID=UPI0005F38E5A
VIVLYLGYKIRYNDRKKVVNRDKRSANFTKSEVNILVDLVLRRKNVIENKRTDATTWKDKDTAWEERTSQFNAQSGNFPRNTKSIRAKYENLKKDLRKKCARLTGEQKKTGGGSNPCSGLEGHEEKLLSISELGMLGLPSRHDSDNFGAVADNTVDENEENKENEDSHQYIHDPDVRQNITETLGPECNIYNSNDEFEDTGDNEAGRSMHVSSPPPDVNTITSEQKELQQQFLQQEIEMRAETHKLNTELLLVELEIKKLQLQR